jgi:peroxidase
MYVHLCTGPKNKVKTLLYLIHVQGCDGSVLLNDTATFTGEQTANPNVGSIRGFGVVDNIKAQVEAVCPGVVSCADILAVAARDSVVAVIRNGPRTAGRRGRSYTDPQPFNSVYVRSYVCSAVQLGGPSWRVLLGRRDSTTASLTLANSDLPAPSLDLANLTAAFAKKRLSRTDLVALSGAHTIGLAQCKNFRAHIYNDTNVNAAFATLRRANCPAAAGNGDGNLAPLDTATPTAFDNAYYTNLLAQRGLLHSDQQLFNGGATDGLVRTYASTPRRFSGDFAAAMIRMGNISPLTGTQGQIRRACSRVN